jgi:hypothetical protein
MRNYGCFLHGGAKSFPILSPLKTPDFSGVFILVAQKPALVFYVFVNCIIKTFAV